MNRFTNIYFKTLKHVYTCLKASGLGQFHWTPVSHHVIGSKGKKLKKLTDQESNVNLKIQYQDD